MQEINKHPFTIEVVGHIAVVAASLISAALLYQKLALTGWHWVASSGVAVFAAFALFVSSEGAAIFLSNLIGLFLQEQKPVGELKKQFLFGAVGAGATLSLAGGLCYFSIQNIVSLQTITRDKQKVDINELQTVKPLRETVESLEMAFKGAENEYQSAQERFISYQGTNQYQNQGKANQAAVKAQNRKDRLEAELKQAREKYFTVYNSEAGKGTNLVDRADNGHNSKVFVAGLLELGALMIAFIVMLLSSYSKSYTLVYTTGFGMRLIARSLSQAVYSEEPAKVAELSGAVEEKITTQMKAPEAFNEVLSIPNDQEHLPYDVLYPKFEVPRSKKTNEPVPSDIRLALVKVLKKSLNQSEVCGRFGLQPYQVSRIVSRAKVEAKKMVRGGISKEKALFEAVDTVYSMQNQPDGPCVYFIQVAGKDIYKIGMCSKQPAKRLADLQVGNPERLILKGWISCPDKDQAMLLERRLHSRFEVSKKEGEWYELQNGTVADVIQEGNSFAFAAK